MPTLQEKMLELREKTMYFLEECECIKKLGSSIEPAQEKSSRGLSKSPLNYQLFKDMEKVMIKSKFYGWQEVSKETVIEYAKWKILAITTCKDNEERLELVNNSIKGMKVSLDEIL